MRLRVKTYDVKRSEAQMHEGICVVWATHPYMPNDSGRARGRVLHLERDDDKFDFPASYCGMMAVKYTSNLSGRRLCTPCLLMASKAKERVTT